MTRGRMRRVVAIVRGAGEARARSIYEEVYGAWPAESVPLERVRASVVEACTEQLERRDRRRP